MEKDNLSMRPLKNSKGQTSIEYIMMIAVVATVITSLAGYIKNRFLGDALQCEKPQNSSKLLCKINALYSYNPNQVKRFKYYPFKK